MKKILSYILTLFLLATSVLAAANLDVSDSVEFYAEQGDTVSKTFTIKNDGDVDLTNIVFTDDADPKYSVSFTDTITTLAVDASATITVNIDVPNDEAIETKDIGNILIDATEIAQVSIPLIEHIGGLDIIDFDVKIGKREKAYNDLNDGELIKPDYTRPGEPVKFSIDIKNLFSEDSKNEINDIKIQLTIIGIGEDGEDVEEESDGIDLGPEDSKGEIFEFSIPIEVEEDEYDIIIDVEGKDDQDIDREIHWTLKLEVEKESHDVKIHRTSLNPTKIICGGTSILSTTIYNFGRAYEDEIKLTIKNSGLGINIVEDFIELDNDLYEEESKWSKTFSIPISRNQKPGTYQIEMWLYFDEDSLDDYRKLELVVEGCPAEEEEEEKPVCGNNKVETGEECDDGNKIAGDGCSALCKKEIIEEEEEGEEEQITGGTVITETKEEGSPWVAILVGVNILVLIIVIVLVVLMFKGKKPEQEGEILK